MDDCLVCTDSHPYRITSSKCRINTVGSPDDGHILAWNMKRLINKLRINCTPSWFYLQDYTGMHDQQNIKRIILYGKITDADYKNHPKYIHNHHHHHHRSGVKPWSVLSRLIFSSDAFPNFFVHLVNISALFWSSCCRSFLLRVVAILIDIFSVSRQPFLLTCLPEILHVVVVKKGVPRSNSKACDPDWCQWCISLLLRVKISLPCRRMRTAGELYISIYVCVCVCVYIYIYIQGVTGGTDQISGECSLC